ncbi:MAG: hypothetical protein ACI4BI_04355 [Anaerotardibacter sp.]
MKKRIILACVLCITCLCLLVGCGSSNAAQNDEQSKNRQYMTQVNSIMDTIKSDLDGFSETLKSGEVVSLDSQLTDVSKQVETLKALEAPEALKSVHDSYVLGAEELQAALKEYVDLYQKVKLEGGSLDAASLASIQEHYDAGITALKDADTKATEA